MTSEVDFLIIKSWQRRGMKIPRVPASLGFQPKRQAGEVAEAWTQLSLAIRPVEGRVLRDIQEIIAATFDNTPLVARTEYSEGGYDICIEHPIKTLNVSEREAVFQTDTGPILLPDFSSERNAQRLAERFDLAYSAFNCTTWTEFVINAPTPLSDEITVDHYSQTRRIENTCNTIVAL